MMNYHNPHPPSRLPRVLSPAEAAKLLDAADSAHDQYAVRDSAILHVLYSTGCRSAELCGMTSTDYDQPNHRIIIRGKFRRERWVFLTGRAQHQLDTWIATRGRWAGPHNYIFVNIPSGAPLADRVLRIIVAGRALHAFGPWFRVHPHMLRHSFATHLTDNGVDLADLARMMGHASLDSTLVYIHTAPNRLAKVHADFHPETARSLPS
jgi:integrase/recombinase XerC